ncbi:hypothetical protein HMN09_00704800 [Mycena chlorophos]|uniref:DUF6534 domain-containing protein n=1 Tax=Mycena chlorophos TaxID=658473 RepID=A0A8H6T1B6_MYCCL|nr:hypothetical protein HMN09_00704800 [Mycena chlorophos]
MALGETVDDTYGLLYIAVVVSAALYGSKKKQAGIVQFWIWIRKYHAKDSLALKTLVIAVVICDTCQEALLSHAVYRYLVSSIEQPTILPTVVETLMVELFFSCAIATLVQQFYCWRIYRIGKSVILAGAVSLVSWTSCVVLMIYSAKAVQLKEFSQVIDLEKLSIAANSLSAGTDVVISLTLITLLQTSKTGFKRSTDLINRLMIFTFNTGLPTSISALLATICIAAFPSTFLYIFFFLLLGRFYTNSLLVTLNSREYIKSASQNSGSRDQYSLEASGRRFAQQQPQATRDPDHITIRIDTDTMQDFHAAASDVKKDR